MRDQDAAVFLIYLHSADSRFQCILITSDFFLLEKSADICRLYERQHIEIYRSILVLKGERRHFASVDRSQVNSAGIDQSVGKSQPLCRIMIAADDKYLCFCVGQLHQKLIKQFHRFG